MTPSLLSEKLRSGETVFGTLIISPSPRWPAVVARSGLDFVFIDTEHVALDRHQLSWMCQAYSALGLPPIVRIPSPDPNAATMVLDGGAGGVIAPYVETPEQAQALRGAVKLRPLKGQRLADRLAGEELELELDGYLRCRNRSALILNIESTPAIAALDEILAVPDLDAVLIGPHDLSCSLGIPEQYDHPDFLAACETIFTKARAEGVGAGIHFWGPIEQQTKMIDLGANLLILSADLTFFQEGLQQHLTAMRTAAGLSVNGPSEADIV